MKFPSVVPRELDCQKKRCAPPQVRKGARMTVWKEALRTTVCSFRTVADSPTSSNNSFTTSSREYNDGIVSAATFMIDLQGLLSTSLHPPAGQSSHSAAAVSFVKLPGKQGMHMLLGPPPGACVPGSHLRFVCIQEEPKCSLIHFVIIDFVLKNA